MPTFVFSGTMGIQQVPDSPFFAERLQRLEKPAFTPRFDHRGNWRLSEQVTRVAGSGRIDVGGGSYNSDSPMKAAKTMSKVPSLKGKRKQREIHRVVADSKLPAKKQKQWQDGEILTPAQALPLSSTKCSKPLNCSRRLTLGGEEGLLYPILLDTAPITGDTIDCELSGLGDLLPIGDLNQQVGDWLSL